MLAHDAHAGDKTNSTRARDGVFLRVEKKTGPSFLGRFVSERNHDGSQTRQALSVGGGLYTTVLIGLRRSR